MGRTGAVSVAVIVPTSELLKQMLHERLSRWTWAAFASVVFSTLGRVAAHNGATLLLVECVIPPHDRDFVAKWMDLGMLVDNTGRERTGAEYQNLLQQSGFHTIRIVPTASPFSIVKAKAA
jgi:hypothetical protein